jgi:large subunit ribosomal protein L24
MRKFHVKKGDTVKVITGEFKGREAKIAAILPVKERVVLEGVSSGKMRTLRKTRKNPNGGMVERPVSVHISNVMKIEPAAGKSSKAKKENVKDA